MNSDRANQRLEQKCIEVTLISTYFVYNFSYVVYKLLPQNALMRRPTLYVWFFFALSNLIYIKSGKCSTESLL